MSTDEPSYTDLITLLKQAAYNSTIYCYYCEYEPLEADYDKCPECGKSNPLKDNGMI